MVLVLDSANYWLVPTTKYSDIFLRNYLTARFWTLVIRLNPITNNESKKFARLLIIMDLKSSVS